MSIYFSTLNNVADMISVTPIGDAPTYVNGELVTQPMILHHVSMTNHVSIFLDQTFVFNVYRKTLFQNV